MRLIINFDNGSDNDEGQNCVLIIIIIIIMHDPILALTYVSLLGFLFKIHCLYIYDKLKALSLLSLSCYKLLYLFYHCLQDFMA